MEYRNRQTDTCSWNRVFAVSWTFKIAAILGVQKTPKMQFYEQVWSVWWLRYSKKLTYNKFEVSDFLNFEKILKIRWKTQKRVIFTKMLFSLRRVKTALVKHPIWPLEKFLRASKVEKFSQKWTKSRVKSRNFELFFQKWRKKCAFPSF